MSNWSVQVTHTPVTTGMSLGASLKESTESSNHNGAGRAFHSLAATTSKAQSLLVFGGCVGQTENVSYLT